MSDHPKRAKAMAQGRTITPGQLWRARQKQQDAQRFNGMKGKRGFLITANRGREAQASQECLQWLDSLPSAAGGGGDGEEDDDDEETDIQTLLQREVDSALVQQKQRRVFDLGLDCLSLIRCPNRVDPLLAALDLFKQVSDSGKLQTTHLEKLIPFQTICHSASDVIVKCALDLFHAYDKRSECKTFALGVKLRGVQSGASSAALDRLGLIKSIADLVVSAQPELRVDLETPDMYIVVEVVRSITGLVIVSGEDYRNYQRFNLRQLASATA
ncbi:hypothetical protein BASA81_001312 [Batrachochytrium salamandrivorans]|nr:hypothetical protein BASA81_001312 [Batrachochytrium salamandrivorans]